MTRLRFLAVALLALALAGSPTQTGRSADDLRGQTTPRADTLTYSMVPARGVATDEGPCVIYALSDMGYDSDLGKWIAQMAPEMIEPKSWQEQGGSGVLRYYAPKNILIVRNTAAIQTKIAGFLVDLKKSLPKGSGSGVAAGKKSPRANVVAADYRTPAPLGTSGPVPGLSSYPVPAPAKPPKHLFHFLIRYEGEGIIDDNVVKYMKVTNQAEKSDKPEKEVADTIVRPPYSGGLTEGIGALGTNDTKNKEDKKDDEKPKPLPGPSVITR